MTELKVKYSGQFSKYYCSLDQTLLAEVHDSGSGIVYTPCPHFEVREYGNLYYELMAPKLNRNAQLHVWNGTTVYILYPKSQ
ncbi:MAG: hypothetical protein L7G90_02795 [Candidatus Nanopusillus sp.]|nr:hypothetical protein [Candidatus Nanopusillus sp.]